MTTQTDSAHGLSNCKCEETIRLDVTELLEKWKDEEGSLIMILHSIEDKYGFVPRNVAMELARQMGIKLARIYEVITFYHYFKLVPPGKHNVTVCMGTACYLKGAGAIQDQIEKTLNVKAGQTTEDQNWHLDVVRCIGCCGMAPAVVVDGKTYGRVAPEVVTEILASTPKN